MAKGDWNPVQQTPSLTLSVQASPSPLPTGGHAGPQPADLLAVTRFAPGRVEEPRGWLGLGSGAQGPGAREMWARHRHGRSRCWRYSQAPRAAYCEGGGGWQEQRDIVLAPGPQPYLIAFQPTHELFFNSVLFSLKRLVTQKFSKFPIITRREET